MIGLENPSNSFELLASHAQYLASTNFENQSFQYGSGVGLQFYLEVYSEMVNYWLDNTEQTLQKIPNINLNKIRQYLESKISIVNDNMEKF